MAKGKKLATTPDEQRRREAREIRKLHPALLGYLPTHRWRGTIGALMAVGIIGMVFLGLFLYSEVTYTQRHKETRAALEKNEALWTSKGVSSYEFTIEGLVYTENGEERSKAAVTVENSVVAAIQFESIQGATPVGSLSLDNVDTVPKLFAEARQTLLNDRGPFESPLSARVSYDSEYGYPTSIDFGSNDALGRVGEYTYQATFLRTLPYPRPPK